MLESWHAGVNLCIFGALLAGYQAYETKDTIGAVIGVKGKWSFEGHSEALLRGEGIPAGTVIKADPGLTNQSISVVLRTKPG
jgi:hypothetical protein